MADSLDLPQGEYFNSRAQRQEQIADYVLQQSFVRVQELADLFNVSLMTVHRDLDELETQGILRKVRGGATVLPSSLFESDVRYRLSTALKEKEAIAEVALSCVEPGQAVLLDASTTILALSRRLPRMIPLTVISNCLTIIQELSKVKGIDLISLGGEFLSPPRCLCGDYLRTGDWRFACQCSLYVGLGSFKWCYLSPGAGNCEGEACDVSVSEQAHSPA